MQSGSAAPPQPTPNSLPPLPVPTQPSKAPARVRARAMATQVELEAAVAALADKKRRLREAFDRLVACSPVPLPFRWEDLEAHLASIAASFSTHGDAIAIAGAAAAGGPTTAARHVEHQGEEEQDRERQVGRGAAEERQGSSNAEEGEEARNASSQSHQERGEEEGEVREASSARPEREADEAGNVLAVGAVPIDAAPPEQLDDDEKEEEDAMGAIVASSPLQSDDDVEMEVVEDEEEGEWLQHPHAAGGGDETSALATTVNAACANMDPSALVDALCLGGRSSLRAVLPALLGAPDPHALLVRAVGGFLDLASAGPGPGYDASEWWANCVALIECAPRLAALSADALAQANRLARHWKEMVVARPAGGRDMAGMAGWGLLTFIASYSIVPEFDSDEMIRLFDNIAPQVKANCVELCKRLGLIGKMTDSIDHFIENGRPLDAIRLAHTFSLTEKYLPLAIMHDYIENAKKTAENILSKESYTLESLNQAMAKKVDALIFSWSAVDGCDIDSVQRNSIKAEITQLLHRYANKQQSLAGASASISSSHQQQNFQEEYQQRQQIRLVEHQQQQRKPHHGVQPKPGEERHQQHKAQETQHRHIQNQQEPQKPEMWQNRNRKRESKKNRKRKQRRQNLQQQIKRPRLPPYVWQGIDNRHGQPFSGTRRAPFAGYTTTTPRYFWSM